MFTDRVFELSCSLSKNDYKQIAITMSLWSHALEGTMIADPKSDIKLDAIFGAVYVSSELEVAAPNPELFKPHLSCRC